MKKRVITGILALGMIVMLGLGANARADGRAAALLIGADEMTIVALFDFNESQFTAAETQELTDLIELAGYILSNLLTQNAPDVTLKYSVFTPDQMKNSGLGDADTANSWIIANYTNLGVDIYAKVTVTKASPPQGVTGQNIRLDFSVYGSDSTSGADQFLYIGSVEIPMYLLELFQG